MFDDCSEDNFFKYIEKKYAAEDSRIKIIEFDKNKGAAKSRNSGLNNSVGEFVAFLDFR